MIYLALSLWPHVCAAFAIGLVTGYFMRRERTGEAP